MSTVELFLVKVQSGEAGGLRHGREKAISSGPGTERLAQKAGCETDISNEKDPGF